MFTIAGLFVLKSGINWIYIWGFHFYEADAARDLRNTVYRGLQRLSFGYLDRADTGQLIARSISDVEGVQSFMGHGATGLVTWRTANRLAPTPRRAAPTFSR